MATHPLDCRGTSSGEFTWEPVLRDRQAVLLELRQVSAHLTGEHGQDARAVAEAVAKLLGAQSRHPPRPEVTVSVLDAYGGAGSPSDMLDRILTLINAHPEWCFEVLACLNTALQMQQDLPKEAVIQHLAPYRPRR